MDFMTIICDLKNSSRLENRTAVQYRLIDTLKEVNQCFAASIKVPFIITMGDEWQGLLNSSSDYSSILNYFHQNLEGIDFYCGIGLGPVTVHDFELTVNQLDGPSFYKARRAIRLAKRFDYSLVFIQ